MLFQFGLTGSSLAATQKVNSTAAAHVISIAFRQMALPPVATCPNAATSSGPPTTICAVCFPNPSFMPPPFVSFDGMSNQGSCREAGDPATWPSDDSGAVGPANYMQSVNLALSVYDKTGKLIRGPVSTCIFWVALAGDCDTNGKDTDQVVLYDRRADRWVVIRPHSDFLYLAVSQMGDPAGIYDQYSFVVNSASFTSPDPTRDFSTYFNDYPKLAVGRDAYYATGRPRDGTVNVDLIGIGNTVTAINRDAVLGCTNLPACAPPAYVTFFVPETATSFEGCSDTLKCLHSMMLPADIDGAALPPPGTPEYVVQVQDEHLGFPSPSQLQIYEFQVDWTNPAAATLTPTTTTQPPQFFDSKACPDIQQRGQSQTLAPLCQGFVMYRLSYRNGGDHETLLFNHTILKTINESSRTAIRWYELRKPLPLDSSQWAIYQQGTYIPDDNDRWLGSIAMDGSGNIALGFDVSSAVVFPSIHYVGRRDSDPLGQLPVQETSLMEGGGSQRSSPNGNQFGDYSQMTLDPIDDCTFWYTNTYFSADDTTPTTLGINWHTRIGAFRFPSCVQFFTRVPVLAINNADGRFTLAALYVPKDPRIAINPLIEDVTLQLGAFMVTIPAGSFTRQRGEGDAEGEDDEGRLTFNGVIGTVHLAVEIVSREEGGFTFKARGKGATTLPSTNPVTVALTIGTDRGSASVAADFKSDKHYESGRR